MTSLAGKTALVTGASGVVGSGVVRAFLVAGATVIAPIRGGASESLQAELEGVSTDKLNILTADAADPEQVQKLADTVKAQYGALDYVVASVGGWWQKGPLLQQSIEELESNFRLRVVSHFALAKYLLPIMQASPESSFTFITGSAGESLVVPDASMITATAAGLFGVIMCVMGDYAKRPGPRIIETALMSWSAAMQRSRARAVARQLPTGS